MCEENTKISCVVFSFTVHLPLLCFQSHYYSQQIDFYINMCQKQAAISIYVRYTPHPRPILTSVSSKLRLMGVLCPLE